jgi:uncharacterized protein YigA (DUF484 family)
MTATLLDDATQARVVAAYLKHHPEFLSEYPELAAKLTMPRDQGPVSSLAIYQLHSLREKNAELERRLAELIEIAAENEQLMERVHALTVALLRANTMEVTARSIVAKLSADFHTEQVRLVLFGNDRNCRVPIGYSRWPVPRRCRSSPISCIRTSRFPDGWEQTS